jgi:hypothetical protein
MNRRVSFIHRLAVSGFFLVSICFGQSTDYIPGTWVENNPGGIGCPALALYSNDSPTMFALTPIGVSTSDFALYILQQNMQDASTGKWENDFPVYNLNPREFVSNLSLTLKETVSSFITWVESKHQYNEPSIVVGRRGGAGEPYYIFSHDTRKDAFAVSSKFDKQGNPVVAWSEGFSETSILSGQVALDYLQQSYYPRYPRQEQNYSDTVTYLKRWDGTTWQDVGTPLNGYNPTLVLDKKDVPYLSYIRTAATGYEVVVVYWDGQAWQQLGDVLTENLFDVSHTLSFILDDEGMPIIAFIGLSESEQPKLIIKRWSGTAWQSLGEDSVVVTGHNPFDASLDYRDGKLVLATIEAKPQTFDFEPPQTLFVKTWNGESWQLLSEGPVSLDAACPVIQVDSQGNLYVAWSQIVSDGHTAYTSVQISHFVRE